MHFLKQHKNIIIGVILVIIGFVLYSIFVRDDGTEDQRLSVTEQANDPLENAIGRDLLFLLDDLKVVELDGAFFTSKEFRNLLDFGQVIAPQPIGRPNPFAPIGASTAEDFTLDLGETTEGVE